MGREPAIGPGEKVGRSDHHRRPGNVPLLGDRSCVPRFVDGWYVGVGGCEARGQRWALAAGGQGGGGGGDRGRVHPTTDQGAESHGTGGPAANGHLQPGANGGGRLGE